MKNTKSNDDFVLKTRSKLLFLRFLIYKNKSESKIYIVNLKNIRLIRGGEARFKNTDSCSPITFFPYLNSK